MKTTTLRTKKITLIGAALLLSCGGVTFAANNEWQSEDGNWFTGNWQLGVPPTGADHAIFSLNTSSTSTSVTVAIDGAASVSHLSVARGKTVTLNLDAGATLSGTSGTWQIGSGTGTGAASAAGHLLIHGPESGRANMAVGAGGINIGAAATQVGNSVEMAGNLDIQIGGNVVVGRFGNGNMLTVKDGTQLVGSGFWVSATQNITAGIGDNNGAVISGTGTMVTLAPANNLALVVAARPTTNLATQQTGNYVRIQDGAVVKIDGTNSATTADLKIGDTSYRVGNYITVTGENSLLEMKNGTKISIGTNINSSYNNYLSVSSGGVIKNDGTTTISNSRTSGGKNRIVVGNLGTFLAGDEIKVAGGLFQLAQGGVLRGETTAGSLTSVNLIVEKLGTAVGRFEAEGSGLASNVITTVKNGGVMAVGLASTTSGRSLSLSSSIDLQSGAVLEMGIFGSNDSDTIDFGETGGLTIASDAVFRLSLEGYSAVAGDSWSLFTGDTQNIIGSFDMSLAVLPTLADGLWWDYSTFNQAGGWEVTVIPEPSSVLLMLSAGAMGLGALRRARSKASSNMKSS